jgi:hypothetical protein
MKKVFFTLIVIAAVGLANKSLAQCNTSVPVIVYNPGPAPFFIDGQTTDWQLILGAPTGNASTPYNPPASSASNWAMDSTFASGLDPDAGSQAVRDLRFFAYTKDATYAYFYFRRITSDASANKYYYFLDITSNNGTSLTPDGFMGNGEPVIEVTYNNGGSASITLLQYVADSTGNEADDFVSGKGNYMVSPITGLADGYSMVGDAIAVTLPTCPGVSLQVAETETGFGTEFRVPFCYLKNYVTNLGPINITNVFTYHISVANNSGIPGTVDNAGGCCAGVAVSDNPLVTLTSATATAIPNSPNAARAYVTYTNQRAAATTLTLNQVKFKLSLFTPDGASTDPNAITVKVYPDPSCTNSTAGTFVTYGYNALASTTDTAVFTNLSPAASITLAANGTGCFVAIADFGTETVKTARMIFATTATYTNIQTGTCQQAAVPTNDQININLITTLPVKFQEFTAVRNNASTVSVRWVTATEQNSAGFYIERNNGSGWQQVGYVATQAIGGTSNAQLVYSFVDANNTARGISQYRIRQVDLDAKAKLSDIRAVRGVDQKSKTIVYPNPSNDGKVTIVFEAGNAIRDISIMDMSGRTVQQMKGVTNNNVQIENLNAGIYSIRILDRGTGEQVVEKIVVNKR